jgi:hypothetical protein
MFGLSCLLLVRVLCRGYVFACLNMFPVCTLVFLNQFIWGGMGTPSRVKESQLTSQDIGESEAGPPCN